MLKDGVPKFDSFLKEGMIYYKQWVLGTSSDMAEVYQKIRNFMNFYEVVLKDCRENVLHYKFLIIYYPTNPHLSKIQEVLDFNLKLLKILEENLAF